MATVEDDLGHRLEPAGPPQRIVSLVPSLTEALAATVGDRLVGATEWCTHPAGLAVARVRGTKNPDHAAIAALRPDLVVANQEENRRTDVERLRRHGIPVWVTRIESVDGAIASLRRLLTVRALGARARVAQAGGRRLGTARAAAAAPDRGADLATPLDGGRVGHLHG